jgi:PAS domain S-box-containing protein
MSSDRATNQGRSTAQAARVLAAARAWMPLLDSLENVMCWVKDTEGRFIEANTALAALVGRGKQELVGLTDQDLFAPEFAAEYQRDDADVMAGGRVVFNKPELIDLARGGAEWRMTSKMPLVDETGRVVGLVCCG